MGRPKKIKPVNPLPPPPGSGLPPPGPGPGPGEKTPQVTKGLEELREDYERAKAEKDQKKTYYQKKKNLQASREFAEGLQPGVSLFIDFLAKRMPNPIPASAVEKEMIGKAFTQVMQKYSSSMLEYSEEAFLVFYLVLFAAPRLQKPKERKDGSQRQEAGNPSNGKNGIRENDISKKDSSELPSDPPVRSII